MTDSAHDFDVRYAAVAARDTRFDGQFITGVRSTGIYCRPSCPAMTPLARNVTFYRTAAAAHDAGLRACKRCQPDAVPGSPEWNRDDDLAVRAMRLIHDGVVDRDGVPGLAARLGYTPRHLSRILRAELGAGPLALARAHRARTARSLLGSTDLPVTDIAFASGFGSVRQFSDTIREIYQATPSELRALSRRGLGGEAARPADAEMGVIELRLPARGPFDANGLFAWFARHAIPGLEDAGATHYRRPLRLPGGRADIDVRPDPERPGVLVNARLARLDDLSALTARLRRLFDLDADSVAIDDALGRDPRLAEAVRTNPGIRLPGSADPGEEVIRALLGQQVSVAAARTAGARLVEALGDGEFPAPATIAERGREVLRGPEKRVAAILDVAERLADGRLVVGPEISAEEMTSQLLAQPGIGPWTASYLSMRILGHPDVLLVEDLAVRQGAAALGLPDQPAALRTAGSAWAPWRSYASLHLWAARGRQ